MVRDGIVEHPEDWPFCGYSEIQQPPQRHRLVDQKALLEKCGHCSTPESFKKDYKQ